MFKDPEARLDTKFAQLFGMQPDNIDYDTPDTVPEVFKPIRTWQPKSQSPINGIFADSLAALSTDMEMSDDDAYGMRRAKEFSEELRKTCRVLKNENFILVGSNQIRDKVGARQFEEQFVVPGGNALGFYASLRLRMYSPKKIYDKATIGRKTIKHVKGVQTKVQVYKSSIWKPFHEADITIIFDYGIDDIRENLQFIKDIKKETMYTLDGNKLDKSMEESIEMIEQDELEEQLKNEVIHIWNEVEEKFRQDRKPKKRRR
jgi:RecA/RadA recombinase